MADIKHLLCPLSFTANTINFPMSQHISIYSLIDW